MAGQGRGRGQGSGRGQGLSRGPSDDPSPVDKTGGVGRPDAPDDMESPDDSLIRRGRSEDSPGHRKQAADAKSARDFAPGRARRT